MEHGRQRNGLISPISALTGIGVLALVFVPGFRQVAFVIGWVSLGIIGLVIVGLALFGIFRLATPERNMRGMTGSVNGPPLQGQKGEKFNQGGSKPGPDAEPALTSQPILTTPELLLQIRSMDWFQFEKLVALVYRKLGYDVTRHGGANPDGGIDLVLQKDGRRKAIQCKHWKAWRVGVKPVREFFGALMDADIPQGKFITLCGYTNAATQFAKRNNIEIVTEAGLAQMFDSTDAKSDPEVLNLLLDTRKFCPKCEREMVIRVAKNGPRPGGKFWGCTGYPDCHFTLPIAETSPAPTTVAPRADVLSVA